MKTSAHTYWTVLLCAAVVMTGGCSRQNPDPIRLGINAWPGYEFLYLAQQKGFFAAEGVQVQIIEFNSLADTPQALRRGQIDGMGCTLIELVQARDGGNCSPQVLYVTDFSAGADVILAQPGITNVAALKGRRVGLELGSVGVYMLARALEKSGMTLADVVLVPSDQMSSSDAFAKGALDAVVSYPPFSIHIQREYKATTLFTSKDLPGEVVDIVAIDAQVAKSRPQEVRGIMRAFERALQFSRQNRDEAYGIMAAREGITPAEFQATLDHDIQMLALAEQEAFLRLDGKLLPLIRRVDEVLRQTKQIAGAERTADSIVPFTDPLTAK